MTQPYPYGGQPAHSWPPDPQAPTIPPHLARSSPPRWLVVFAVAAMVAAVASLTIQGLNVIHSGSASDVTHLRGQVVTLQHQHTQDTRTIGGLQRQVTTLADQAGTLSKQVGGMAPTVRNLAPFANGVCPGLFQGSKGAFSASVPCRT